MYIKGVEETKRRDGSTSFRIKYRDADGRQIEETIGTDADGWTRRRAEDFRQERRVDVRRDGYRRPGGVTFADLAKRFEHDHLPTRNLKHSTLSSWRTDLHKHLTPGLGEYKLGELEQRPELIERYAAKKLKKLSAKTVRNQLVNLSRMFKVAVRWGLMRANPCDRIDLPKVTPYEPTILDAGQIAGVLAAFRELEHDAAEEQKPWFRAARRLWHLDAATAGRCGELFGLRWRRVSFAEGSLRIVETYTRNRVDTPKSRESHRTLGLGPVAQGILAEQWGELEFTSDEDLVFCHPVLGTHLDPAKIRRDYIRPALRKAGIPDSFRPFHDLRHTALTHDAAIHAPAVVKVKAGHASITTTERYVHLAGVHLPGVAEESEARLFGQPGQGEPDV